MNNFYISKLALEMTEWDSLLVFNWPNDNLVNVLVQIEYNLDYLNNLEYIPESFLEFVDNVILELNFRKGLYE
jgi:hypothetical protein